MYKSLEKEISLPLLSIVNQLLVVSTRILIYTLVFRCFTICSSRINFHNELTFLKDIFLKYGYPISLINKCYKTLLGRLYLKRTQDLTAKKKTLTFVLFFLKFEPSNQDKTSKSSQKNIRFL